LVLTAKPGRSFRIGDNIVIAIIDTSAERVKIGFDAPLDMRICRDNAKDQEPRERDHESK
jgi:carbon storage regulator CsrA